MDLERLTLALKDGWQLRVEKEKTSGLFCGWLVSKHDYSGDCWGTSIAGVMVALNQALVASDEAELADEEDPLDDSACTDDKEAMSE